jgi:hypothetical protein
MTAEPAPVPPPAHPLPALTTSELARYRHQLETALAAPAPPRPGCATGSPPCSPSRPPAPASPQMGIIMADPGRSCPPGQLTTGHLDRYARQLARCLKALATDAPIRADVQQELADVRAEQHHRATAGAVTAAPDPDRAARR